MENAILGFIESAAVANMRGDKLPLLRRGGALQGLDD